MKLVVYGSKAFSSPFSRQGRPGAAWRSLGGAAALAVLLTILPGAAAQQARYARKYKPLPQLSHIVVLVQKGFDGKPMANTPVVFHSTFQGRDDGNMEVKTDPNGNATMDLIQVGSDVDVQVIAKGYATYSHQLTSVGAKESLVAKMVRPHDQVSQWETSAGQVSSMKPGIQEPPHPALVPPKPNVDGFALPPSSPAANPSPADGPANSPGTSAQQTGTSANQTGNPQ